MKRLTYEVTTSAGQTARKYAFNSAAREAESLLRAHAAAKGLPGIWTKIEGTIKKDGYTPVSGTRAWRHNSGEIFRAEIALIP